MKINSELSSKNWECGFYDPDLRLHQTFRAIFDAMDHPGQIVTICEDLNPQDVLNAASAATCLTSLDYETPVWTDVDWKNPAINWLQFDCDSSILTEPCMANFAIITKPVGMPPLDYFRIGSNKYSEKTTTMVVQNNGCPSG